MRFSRRPKVALLAWVFLLPATALAQRESTRSSLLRFEETMALQRDEGTREVRALLPLIVVSTTAAFEETKAWYPTAAISALVHVFGSSGIRVCEACMAPHAFIQNGRFEQSTTARSTTEISQLDAVSRGLSAPARAAVWLDETVEGVSLRIIDLQNSRVVVAQNFDPMLEESADTRRRVSLSEELDRRSKRIGLTHAFIDVVLFPGQHVSLDWAEQFGETNANFAGVTLSAFDPILGIGAVYFRVIPQALNLMVGAKLILSVPTALVSAFTNGAAPDGLERIVTGVFMARLPIASSNFAVNLSVSTNGRVGVGISLLNFSLLPFLP